MLNIINKLGLSWAKLSSNWNWNLVVVPVFVDVFTVGKFWLIEAMLNELVSHVNQSN